MCDRFHITAQSCFHAERKLTASSFTIGGERNARYESGMESLVYRYTPADTRAHVSGRSSTFNEASSHDTHFLVSHSNIAMVVNTFVCHCRHEIAICTRRPACNMCTLLHRACTLSTAAGNSFRICYHMRYTTASATQARLDPPQHCKLLLLGLSIWTLCCSSLLCFSRGKSCVCMLSFGLSCKPQQGTSACAHLQPMIVHEAHEWGPALLEWLHELP